MKNIPTPSRQSYELLLIDKIESVIKRMHLKAYFFMENKAATLEEPSKETYRFKSKHHPSQSKYLEASEKTCLTWPTHSNLDAYAMTFNKK